MLVRAGMQLSVKFYKLKMQAASTVSRKGLQRVPVLSSLFSRLSISFTWGAG